MHRNTVRSKGFEPYLCENEDEARDLVNKLPQNGKWPCLFTPSNTTGEKDFEEFFTSNEIIDLDRFQNLGIVKNGLADDSDKLDYFLNTISGMRKRGNWTKEEIVSLFHEMIPDFGHEEKGKYLDSKM